MSEFVQPDRIFQIPYEDGDLQISPAHDVIHAFRQIGAFVFKYWDCENRRFLNIAIEQPAVDYLVEHCEVAVAERATMSHSEHENWIEYQASILERNIDAE